MKSGILLVLILITASLRLQGQSVLGSIGGRVLDSTGAPLPGVRITVVESETNRKRTSRSDSQGEFVIALLPPGAHRLEAELAGYRKHILRIALQVNQDFRTDVSLAPGSLTEVVEVTATRGLIRTETAALGTVIENHQINRLPLDGRNFIELTLLAPGTAPAAPGSAGSVRGDFAVNINGGREDSNNFLLDGIYNGDPKLGGFGVIPPVDAIQEFEVLTSSYDAAFGRSAGGQVNVAVKSGTNKLHGSAYEFFRNAATDARNYFAPAPGPAPQNQRNQFGFVLGGPVRKDRTFFLADYEGRRVREGITRISNVPTALERAGDFSESSLPGPIDIFTGQPFADRRIPPNRLDATGLAIAALYPLPNRTDSSKNFVASPALRDREDHFDFRLDHSAGERSDLAVRYSFSDRDLFEPFSGPLFAVVPGFGTSVPRRAQNVMVSETHVFTPTLLNELRLGFNRVAAGAFHENSGKSLNSSVGLPELSADSRDFGLSFITLPGFSPLGDEFNNPQHSVTNVFQVLDHATATRGSHTFKFGFDFRALQQNAFRDVQSRGFLNFLGFTGNPLSDLLMGFPALTGGARVDNHQHLRTESYNFFFQHNFRIRSGLTLTAGLRYEYNSPPVDVDDRANIYEPASQSLVPVGSSGIPRSGYASDRNNLGPRLGLAWSPGNNPRTVIRAGYGVFYDQSALAPGEGLYFNAPFFDFRIFFPLPGLPLTLNDPFPAFFPVTLPSSALAFQRDLRTPYMQHWNFDVQRDLGRNRMIEVAYAGSKGSKLLTARDINQPFPSAQVPNLRPVPQFDDINLLESRSNSSYNSLQVRFQQRFESGLSVLSAYTWSKSLDDASSFFSSSGDPNFPQDSYDVQAERGRSNFDLRHRFSLSYSYALPFGKGQKFLADCGWASSVFAGWQTNGILTFQSGRPFTVALQSAVDNSNTGRSILGFGANDRPDRVANPALSNPTPERWFDTSAFVLPTFGSFGNAGRNILEGPGYRTVNASLLKDTTIREGVTLQFRTEVFNLFNRANFGLPDIFFASPAFGQILSAGSPRRIQFGLKLLF